VVKGEQRETICESRERFASATELQGGEKGDFSSLSDASKGILVRRLAQKSAPARYPQADPVSFSRAESAAAAPCQVAALLNGDHWMWRPRRGECSRRQSLNEGLSFRAAAL